MYGNFFVNTQISANLRNKLQEYTQSPDKITQKYERIHSFTKRTVRSFRKFEVRVNSVDPDQPDRSWLTRVCNICRTTRQSEFFFTNRTYSLVQSCNLNKLGAISTVKLKNYCFLYLFLYCYVYQLFPDNWIMSLSTMTSSALGLSDMIWK